MLLDIVYFEKKSRCLSGWIPGIGDCTCLEHYVSSLISCHLFGEECQNCLCCLLPFSLCKLLCQIFKNSIERILKYVTTISWIWTKLCSCHHTQPCLLILQWRIARYRWGIRWRTAYAKEMNEGIDSVVEPDEDIDTNEKLDAHEEQGGTAQLQHGSVLVIMADKEGILLNTPSRLESEQK